MNHLIVLTTAFLIASANLAFAETVISCNDGDTCQIETSQGLIKVRLRGIDAPEARQIGGSQARSYLSQMVVGRDVDLKCEGSSGDREACQLFLDGVNIQAEMVKAGWAWDYTQHSRGAYLPLQRAAKKARRGLWQQPNPVNPECFRYPDSRQCDNKGD